MSGRPILDAQLSSAAALSREVSGSELLGQSMKGYFPFVMCQVIPSADGDFEIRVEHGINTDAGVVQWDKTGKLTQETEDEEGDLIRYFNFNPVPGCLYRVRHVSGLACRVMMSG